MGVDAEIEADKYSDEDDINYSTIDVTFDFEDDVFRILLTDYVYDTQGFSTESELDNNDEKEKENFKITQPGLDW